MLITSVQIAMLNPGLPLGLSDVSPGYKRKTTQVFLIVFSPITILLLRLQHQIVLKKRENTLEMQQEYDIPYACHYNLLLIINCGFLK